jgi:hypothetical protein
VKRQFSPANFKVAEMQLRHLDGLVQKVVNRCGGALAGNIFYKMGGFIHPPTARSKKKHELNLLLSIFMGA